MNTPPRIHGLPPRAPDGRVVHDLLGELHELSRARRSGAILITVDDDGALRLTQLVDGRDSRLSEWVAQRLMHGLESAAVGLAVYLPPKPTEAP
jgi:hypothetical protein